MYKSGKNSSEKLAYKKIKTHEKKYIFMIAKNGYAQKLVPTSYVKVTFVRNYKNMKCQIIEQKKNNIQISETPMSV